jgi:TPR repeat protein
MKLFARVVFFFILVLISLAIAAYSSPAKFEKMTSRVNEKTLILMVSAICTLNPSDHENCNNVALYFGQKNDFKSMRKYLSIACDNGGQVSCFTLALDLTAGLGGPREHTRAFTLLFNGCELGDAKSCFYLGKAYYDGIGTNESVSDAFSEYRKACSMGHQEACDSYVDED